MATSRRILTGVAIALLIALVGVGAGLTLRNFSDHKTVMPPSEGGAPEGTAEPSINETYYDASPPSRGRAHTTVKIALSTVGGNNAIIFLPSDKTLEIAMDQSVLLYAADNRLLNLIGKIVAMTPGTGPFEGQTAITITIPPSYDVQPSDIVRSEIITEVFPVASRLPLSALQKNDNGDAYIWEAVSAPNGTVTAILRPLISLLEMDGFFMFENPDFTSNLYILKPDGALENGQILANVRKVLYSAPTVADDERIAQLPQPRFILQQPAAAPTPGGTSACGGGDSAGGSASACGGGAASFIDIVRQKAFEQKALEQKALEQKATEPQLEHTPAP